MMSPASFAVFALKALQKSMMLTPCGPSAVPTGGAGVALPAGICSFTEPVTFFAITKPSLQSLPCAHVWGYIPGFRHARHCDPQHRLLRASRAITTSHTSGQPRDHHAPCFAPAADSHHGPSPHAQARG